eukprot:TRINITY_DN1476_c0_g1_i2.p1 TRINITY_DN1476_c0_g1~~TRINITY_DN1476_c0_g1_i2.p1  ORF type:complete len:137 (-),score=38.87 TRINITY_DN1476_c0_g1_i2:133-543(-)
MGCGGSKGGDVHARHGKRLSPELRKKVLAVFRKIDVDDSKTIDRAETLKFWQSNFAKLNTEALFTAVDKDKNGAISEDEWLDFWDAVKKAGHSDEEIEEEINNLDEGKAWVYFDKVPTEAGRSTPADTVKRRKSIN